MKWIRSAGGPLICVERDLASLWMGTCGNSQFGGAIDTHETDYDRACAVSTYAGKVQLGSHYAMILGDMPMETAILNSLLGLPLIVRVVYKDPDTDIPAVLAKFGSLDSIKAVERMPLQVLSGAMVIFDSADLESDVGDASLDLTLPQGHYDFRTLAFEPDSRTAVVVHEFLVAGLH